MGTPSVPVPGRLVDDQRYSGGSSRDVGRQLHRPPRREEGGMSPTIIHSMNSVGNAAIKRLLPHAIQWQLLA